MSVLSLSNRQILCLADLHEEFYPHLSAESLLPLLRRNPASFPPFFLLPGRVRGRFWKREVVEAWFGKLAQAGVLAVAEMPGAQVPVAAPKSHRVGRPSKAELKARAASRVQAGGQL